MHRIFISYRRSEAAFAAGALGRELRQYFGEAQVFRDREDIEGGMSWRTQVLSAIDGDSALLVLIDKQWLAPAAGHQQPRLFEADDPVRLEILDALQDGATIIPLLLDDAEMPSSDALPPELVALSEINALPLRDADWPYDFARLCTTLEHSGFSPVHPHRHLGIGPLRPQRPDTMRPLSLARGARTTRRRLSRAALLYASAGIALAVAGFWWLASHAVEPSSTPAEIAVLPEQRAVTSAGSQAVSSGALGVTAAGPALGPTFGEAGVGGGAAGVDGDAQGTSLRPKSARPKPSQTAPVKPVAAPAPSPSPEAPAQEPHRNPLRMRVQ